MLSQVMKIVPNLRIFNAKPIEAISISQNENSRKGSKLNKDEGMPDRDPVDSSTKKKEKRKRSKQQVESHEEPAAKDTPPAVAITAPVKSALLDSKKKKKEKVVVEQDKSSKPKSKDDKASSNDTEGKAKKEKKKSANKEDKDAGGIDDTEVSFAELMFSGDGSVPEPVLKDKPLGTAADGKFVGGLVIDHTKKRKKAKGIPMDASDLKQLCSAPEVGAGGLSGWD
ncbi:Protein phosphatase 1 regulatory subunit 7 [Hordeum vulgare]|nr:Protein phosphatase 1 regulatory subunit 7 [Hordeum vulgare]